MRALVVSSNRLAEQGLQGLARRSDMTVQPATLWQAVAPGQQVDLTLLYADEWGEDTRTSAACLHANHVRFISIVGAMNAAVRKQALGLGALEAFDADQADDLVAALRNLDRTASGAQRFALANGFVVDLAHRQVHRGGRFFELGKVECGILAILRDETPANPSGAVPLARIALRVYGSSHARGASTVRVHIHHLRSKIEVAPDRPTVLICHRAHGYQLRLARSRASGEQPRGHRAG